MTNLIIAHFSYTGNTAYVATQLATHLNAPCVNLIDEPLQEMASCQHVVICFAIHAFCAPTPVVDQLKQLKVGQFQRISFIGVGCHESSLNQGVFRSLETLVSPKCQTLGVQAIIAMPLTLIKKVPDEKNRECIQQAQQKILTIKDAILTDTTRTLASPRGHQLLKRVGQLEQQAAKLFGLELHATKDCVKCGRCWSECPMKNITPSNYQTPKFHFKCSMCLKCIYDCPKQAIRPRVSTFIPIKGGYQLRRHLK